MKVKYLQFDSKRRFGIEIELNRQLTQIALRDAVASAVNFENTAVHGWEYTCNNSRWIIKPDSSCGDLGNKNKDGGGYEVASAVGTGRKHLKRIASVTQSLNAHKAHTNQHCAFHCQVEIKDFTRLQAATLLAYWCKIEKFMAQTVPSYRAKSKYCRPFTGNKTKWPKAQEVTDAASFWKLMKLSGLHAVDKRNSLTLVNYQRTVSTAYDWDYFNRPTVELRYPESSLRSYDTKNWSRLFVHFVETCANRQFPSHLEPASLKEALIILGLKDKDQFSVLSPGLFETKLWLLHRLNQYCTNISLRKNVLREFALMNSEETKWIFGFPKVTPLKMSKDMNSEVFKKRVKYCVQ